MFVLEALDSGDYSLFGEAIVTDTTPRLFRFDAYFQITALSMRFTAAGKLQVASQPGGHEFFLEIRPLDNTTVSFLYRDPWVPQVRGTGTWVKDCYLLSGQCDRTDASLTCCIEPMENQIIEVKAAVRITERKRVALHFTLSPHEPKMAMANVISLQHSKKA